MLRELAIGQLFARQFRVLGRIGEGGMGAVYEVEQTALGAKRALKIMHTDLAEDVKLRARFEQEARIGATIPSDHIVQVVAAGIDEETGTPFIAMELLDGESLAAYAGRLGRVAPEAVAEIFEQLGHALGEAHRLEIVHRDLKPENIFMARPRRAGVSFTVKVLDFGIAKVLAEATTKATAAVGTPLWMAPEQTATKQGVTPATDVWALGLIAYRLLSGKPYWASADEHSNAMMVMREVVFDPLPIASERAKQLGNADALPSGFDEWFGQCVVREVERRFQTGEEACRALTNMLRPRGMDRTHLAANIAQVAAARAPAPGAMDATTPIDVAMRAREPTGAVAREVPHLPSVVRELTPDAAARPVMETNSTSLTPNRNLPLGLGAAAIALVATGAVFFALHSSTPSTVGASSASAAASNDSATSAGVTSEATGAAPLASETVGTTVPSVAPPPTARPGPTASNLAAKGSSTEVAPGNGIVPNGSPCTSRGAEDCASGFCCVQSASTHVCSDRLTCTKLQACSARAIRECSQSTEQDRESCIGAAVSAAGCRSSCEYAQCR